MRLPLLQLWRSFRASYWFVPLVMVVLAIVLGAGTVWLDAGPAGALFDGIGWYQKSKPEGARQVLAAIAGSMITVAGVVFSITIVAISFAANQYGPRILTNFLGDRGNQVTLGTFIATFVYSIVVLRTIYGGEPAFVPQLAIVIAMLLALCSIIVLIYFIHHVPDSIHVNTIAARVGRRLMDLIEEEFPQCFGDAPEHTQSAAERYSRSVEAAFGGSREAESIEGRSNGYVQAVDEDRLLSIAREYDLIVRVECGPGEFVHCGLAIASAAPAERVSKDAEDSIRHSWAVGSRRTPDQDVLFLMDELVEIAARALSTGVNDPYTAMTCTDWLTAAAAELGRRRNPSPYRLDDDGRLRVVVPAGSLQVYLERGFGRLRPYAATDANVAKYFLSKIGLLARESRSEEQSEALSRQAEALFELAREQHQGPSLEAIEQEIAATRAAILSSRSRPMEKDAVEMAAGSGDSRRVRK